MDVLLGRLRAVNQRIAGKPFRWCLSNLGARDPDIVAGTGAILCSGVDFYLGGYGSKPSVR